MKRRAYRGKPGTAANIGISLLILLLGLSLGAFSEWADVHNGILAELTSGIALWVLLASVVALRSRSLVRAGLHTLLLLGGMAAACCITAAVLGVPWSKNFLIGWGAATLLSPFAGALVWFAWNEGRWEWLAGSGVLAVQIGVTIRLFGKVGLVDLSVIILTALVLFWDKLKKLGGTRARRRRR